MYSITNLAIYVGLIVLMGWKCNYCLADENEPYLLPKTLSPSNYRLLVYTNMDTEKHEYWGTVDIKATCNESNNKIVLNASASVAIPDDSVTVELISNDGNKFIAIDTPTRDEDNDLYIIPLKENLVVQAEYVIHLPFSSVLRDDGTGYYLSTFTDTAGQDRFMALTQFGYADTRLAIPCFNQPNLKATFVTTVAHSDKYFALNNMPIANTSNEFDEANQITWVLDTFQETPYMAPNTVVWAIVDSVIKSTETETEQSKVKIYVWAREQIMPQVELAKNTASGAITYLETFFNLAYPLPQLHIIFVEDMTDTARGAFGRMLFSEWSMLYDEATMTKYLMFDVVSGTCYLIVEQWTANCIATTVWWDSSIWLTVAIPNYLNLMCTNQLYPNWTYIEYTIVRRFINILTEDSQKEALPVARQFTDISKIDDLFDDTVYNKGSYLMRMVNLFMGEAAFQEGFAAYVDKFKYSSANADQLWDSLTGPALNAGRLPEGYDMKKIMDPWSKQPGGPVVIVERDYVKRQIKLTQRRFLLKSQPDDGDNSCWPIAITFITSRNQDYVDTTPQYWLTCEGDLTFDIDLDDNEFIVFNKNLMVLSRFLYDTNQWTLIKDILTNESTFDQINNLSRVQILSDMVALTRSGLLDYKIAFDTFPCLRFEPNYLPWSMVLPLLGKIRPYVYRSDFIEPYTAYVKYFAEEKFKSFNGINTLPEEYVELNFKSLFVNWGCIFDLADCRQQCANIFEWWSNDPDKNLIVTNFRSTIFCYAILVGNESQWDFLYQRYLKSKDESEKTDILLSLGCSQNPDLLNKALDMSLDKNMIPPEDSCLIFIGIANNDIGYPFLKNFITNRYEEIYNYQGGDESSMWNYLSIFSSVTYTQTDLDDVKTFFKWVQTNGNVPGLKDMLDEDIRFEEEDLEWFLTYESVFRDAVTNRA